MSRIREPKIVMNSKQLIETIKIHNGSIANIEYHNARFNRTQKELFNINNKIQLQNYITPPKDNQLYRCRVWYAKEIEKIEYIPYMPKEQRRFIVVESDIDYRYKYANRQALDELKTLHSTYDDIIIAKDGLLCDTTIANIAFFDGSSWYTPSKPLLKGTMRAFLLDKGNLKEKDIIIDDIKNYRGFAIMNAMIGFKIVNNFSIRTFNG
ncbi:MAG: aminotransferase class IV [Campylobacterota bacterium]|nr:aminotransferase class IV [Campylobacterota bacterium]